jgi:hypothetical protein
MAGKAVRHRDRWPSGAAAALCPEHIKKRWLERLGDHHPPKTISANQDLVRATRL